jgi:hypothetical protein
MNRDKQTNHSSIIRRALATAVSIVLAAVCAAAQAQTPSTDRDNPTPLTTNVITGVGVNEKTEYFYSFAATPGDVKLLLEVTADKKAAVSSVDIAVFDSDANSLLSTYANPDHGSSKHAAQTITIKSPQTLLLQVTVSPGVNTFKISLSGSVNIEPAAPTDASDSSAAPAGTNDTSSGTSTNGSSDSNSGNVDQQTQDDLSKPSGPHVIEGTTVNKKTQRIFEFSAGPGDVTLQLNVKSLPNAAVSSVDVELLDSKKSELAAGFANPSFGESKQTIIKAHLKQKQSLTLKVIISPGVKSYSLKVSGAVNGHLDEAGITARLYQIDPAVEETSVHGGRTRSIHAYQKNEEQS